MSRVFTVYTADGPVVVRAHRRQSGAECDTCGGRQKTVYTTSKAPDKKVCGECLYRSLGIHDAAEAATSCVNCGRKVAVGSKGGVPVCSVCRGKQP